MAKKIKTVAGTDGYEYPITSYELVVDENGESIKDKLAQLSGGSDASISHIYYNVLDYGISTEAEDNRAALQSLIDTVNANGGGTIYFPNGTYNFKPTESGAWHAHSIVLKSNVSIIGENANTTILKCSEASTYALFYSRDKSSNAPLEGCTFSNFTIDAYSTGNTNKVWGKAFYCEYLRRCVFRDLILKGTIATALGIDFLDQVVIDNVTCIDCGRTFVSETSTSGTSGIGIGTGGWNDENFIITNCVCVGSGQYGIFIEDQHMFSGGDPKVTQKGCIISNCITRDGLYRGIGVRGGCHVIVENCISYNNTQDGFYADHICKNVKFNNNISVENKGNGALINSDEKSTEVTLDGNLIRDNTGYGIKLNTATDNLNLVSNITRGNVAGLFGGILTHTDTVIKNNIFKDNTSIESTVFGGITTYNDLVNNSSSSDGSVTITAINSDTPISLVVDKSKTISFTVQPSNASKDKVTATTENTDIISISGFTITGLKAGTAVVVLSAEEGTVTKEVTVNVTEPTSTDANLVIDIIGERGAINQVTNSAYTIEASEASVSGAYVTVKNISTNFKGDISHTAVINSNYSTIPTGTFGIMGTFIQTSGAGIANKADGLYTFLKSGNSVVQKLNQSLTTTQDFKLAYSYDADTKEIKYYINDTLITTLIATNPIGDLDFVVNFDLGNNFLSRNSTINIKYLKVYSTVLSQEEISYVE